MICLWQGDAPVIVRPGGQTHPTVRAPHNCRQPGHFGGVFDDDPDRIDEVGEDVVARAVATDAPGDWKSRVDHEPRAAHHRFEVWHYE